MEVMNDSGIYCVP